MTQFTTAQISDAVNGTLQGNPELLIDSLDQLAQATPSTLSFVRDQANATDWNLSSAGAILATQGIELSLPENKAIIYVQNADLAMAKVLELFAPPEIKPQPGIHPTAIIDPTAIIAKNAIIGPYCIIGKNVKIGEKTILHATINIMDDAALGNDTLIYPNVVIRERSIIGNNVILHPGVVIGADGFGYRASEDGKSIVKLPHIGNVILHDHVELGSNTTVDRGKFSATIIGAYTKIDNLCQIAHNVEIGQGCLIASGAGIAGSTKIGNNVMMGGTCGVKDNVTIGNNVKLAGRSGVVTDIPDNAIYSGMPAKDTKENFREIIALKKLPAAMKEINKLYKQFKK